jgi:hypothetical protein
MDPGYGYAAEGKTGETGVDSRVFKGQPNNGIIYYDLKGNFADSDPDNDFNLIGNPYPSAINITDFFDVNQSVMDETVYLWTHATPISNVDNGDFTTSDYATYDRTGGTRSSDDGVLPRDILGSAQGFFVRATTSGQIEFNNSMRRAGQNNLFFKNDNANTKIKDDYKEKNRIWLNLITEQGGFNQILIGFSDNATEGVDKGYDALKLESGNPISLYSHINNDKYVIQSLDSFNDEKTIRLGFDTKVSPRMFTIKIDKTEGVLKDQEIILTDNLSGESTDLSKGDYTFNQTETGEFNDRFTLQFTTALDVDDEILSKDLNIYPNPVTDILSIDSKTIQITKVEIYSIIGQKVKIVNSGFNTISTDNLSGGIYLIKVFSEKGNTIRKLIKK